MFPFPALTYGCKVFIKDTVWLKHGSMDLSMNLAIKSLFQLSFFKVNLRNSEYIFFTLECAVLRGRMFPPNLKGQQPKTIIKTCSCVCDFSQSSDFFDSMGAEG